MSNWSSSDGAQQGSANQSVQVGNGTPPPAQNFGTYQGR
jgi:hypothetical protein